MILSKRRFTWDAVLEGVSQQQSSATLHLSPFYNILWSSKDVFWWCSVSWHCYMYVSCLYVHVHTGVCVWTRQLSYFSSAGRFCLFIGIQSINILNIHNIYIFFSEAGTFLISCLASDEWIQIYLLAKTLVSWMIMAYFWALLYGLFSASFSGSLCLLCLTCLMPSGNNFTFTPLHKLLHPLGWKFWAISPTL